jgi:hypothetical protein
MRAKERRNRNLMQLSELLLELSVFKEASRSFIFFSSLQQGRLKIRNPFAHVQKVKI